jgi:hypothetical protein
MLVRGASSVGRLGLPSATGVVYSDGTDLVAAPTDYFCWLDLTVDQAGAGGGANVVIDWTRSQSDTKDIHNLTTKPTRLYMPIAGMWCVEARFRTTGNNVLCQPAITLSNSSSALIGIWSGWQVQGINNTIIGFVNCTDPGNATDQSSEYLEITVWQTSGNIDSGDTSVMATAYFTQLRMFHMPGMSRVTP